MPSSLSSSATQSITHLRNQKSADGWAGEEVETTVEISASIPCRIEWVEGGGSGWDVWVFEQDHDFRAEDIFLTDQVDAALVVVRVSSWDDLRGNFHHYEIVTNESEATVAQVTP
jgi:hypothetical protein